MTLSSHVKRWITGLSALPVLIIWLGWGSPPMFALLIALVCLLSMREYFQMALNKNAGGIYPPLTMLGYVLGVSIIWAAYSNSASFILAIITANFLLCGFFFTAPIQNRSFHRRCGCHAGSGDGVYPGSDFRISPYPEHGGRNSVDIFSSGDRVCRRYRGLLCGFLSGPPQTLSVGQPQ
jgi:hypothetical protein